MIEGDFPSGMEWSFATTAHADVLFEIFHGARMKAQSPVADLSVEQLRGKLVLSGKTFADRADYYRLFASWKGEIIGTFVIKSLDWDGSTAEIGFSIRDAWQGKGFGHFLAGEGVAIVFKKTGLRRLWATTSIGNLAAQRILERCGFTLSGEYKEKFLINSVPVAQLYYVKNRV